MNFEKGKGDNMLKITPIQFKIHEQFFFDNIAY